MASEAPTLIQALMSQAHDLTAQIGMMHHQLTKLMDMHCSHETTEMTIYFNEL